MTSNFCARCGQRNSHLNRRCIACDQPLSGNPETSDQRPAALARTTEERREHEEKAQDAKPDYIRKLDHFQLIDVLGSGGMGEVFRAYDERLDRLVAVKVVRLQRPHDQKKDLDQARKEHRERVRIRRFIDEAQLAARLDHPNIVPIYQLGETPEGDVYFAMKMVEGVTLSQILKKAGPNRLDPANLAEFLQIFIRVCEALAFAHDRGLVHRDIKPSNIMIGSFAQVYLMDWGAALLLSKVSEEASTPKQRIEVSRENSVFGTVVGTLQYMPPEQAKGRRDLIDARSDVFSLGATLYHIVTGRAPYIAREVNQLLALAQSCHFAPPDVLVRGGEIPHRLVEIIMKAMAPEPEDRYPSVSDLQEDLENFVHGAWHPTQSHHAGDRIVTEGEEARAAFVIEQGHCAVVDLNGPEPVILRQLGPGEVFGETAIFSNSRRTATVEALDEVTLTVVTRDALMSGLAPNSSISKFVKTLADRFEEVDHDLREARQAARKITGV